MNELYAALLRHDPSAWRAALAAIDPQLHPVDRNATHIWFAFFPLELHLALEAAPDPDALVRRLELKGRWRLDGQIGSSHRFLYAHRYWPQVRSAMESADGSGELADVVREVATAAAPAAGVAPGLLYGIAAVLLMTLRQVGPDAFRAEPATVHLSEARRTSTPDEVLRKRARDDSQGLLGFLRGVRKQWTVTFDEDDPAGRFRAIDGQEIATAARVDRRDFHARDPRCVPNEGPIPVQCRSASCGMCWIGVLGGAEKLSPVDDRDERRRMRVFGYLDSPDERPILRLACQARAHGAVSIVIPPWNGVISTLTKR